MYKLPSLAFLCKLLVRVGGFGILFKIMSWSFANELMCFGFIGVSVFLIILLIEKRNKKKERERIAVKFLRRIYTPRYFISKLF